MNLDCIDVLNVFLKLSVHLLSIHVASVALLKINVQSITCSPQPSFLFQTTYAAAACLVLCWCCDYCCYNYIVLILHLSENVYGGKVR